MSLDPSWLDSDFRAPVEAPIRGDVKSRSPELLEAIIDQHQVETARRYERRDVTGDGVAETFCNVFARDVCRALGAPLPEGKRANELVQWLQGPEGRAAGWEQTSEHVARAMADQGQVVVPVWFNRAGPGHMAVMRPARGNPTSIAQAGRTNFARGSLQQGFGRLTVSFFVHP